jgi:hypothetical protein
VAGEAGVPVVVCCGGESQRGQSIGLAVRQPVLKAEGAPGPNDTAWPSAVQPIPGCTRPTDYLPPVELEHQREEVRALLERTGLPVSR